MTSKPDPLSAPCQDIRDNVSVPANVWDDVVRAVEANRELVTSAWPARPFRVTQCLVFTSMELEKIRAHDWYAKNWAFKEPKP